MQKEIFLMNFVFYANLVYANVRNEDFSKIKYFNKRDGVSPFVKPTLVMIVQKVKFKKFNYSKLYYLLIITEHLLAYFKGLSILLDNK